MNTGYSLPKNVRAVNERHGFLAAENVDAFAYGKHMNHSFVRECSCSHDNCFPMCDAVLQPFRWMANQSVHNLALTFNASEKVPSGGVVEAELVAAWGNLVP